MSPEAQRVAIAEACGWFWATHDNAGGICWLQIPGSSMPGGWWRVSTPKCRNQGVLISVPDYLTDLNAMHEAEKVLPSRDAYCRNLIVVCDPDAFASVVATAAQRAEAFLRTMNLWRDDQ